MGAAGRIKRGDRTTAGVRGVAVAAPELASADPQRSGERGSMGDVRATEPAEHTGCSERERGDTAVSRHRPRGHPDRVHGGAVLDQAERLGCGETHEQPGCGAGGADREHDVAHRGQLAGPDRERHLERRRIEHDGGEDSCFGVEVVRRHAPLDDGRALHDF